MKNKKKSNTKQKQNLVVEAEKQNKTCKKDY